MDKFTVDLDQVLNDFEYSELTDQYNASAKVADSSSSTAVPNQNVTKHSINNVFHSLNEYLNTDINLSSVEPIDNNIDHTVGDFASSVPEEKSIKEEIKTDVYAISQSNDLPETHALIVDEIYVEDLFPNFESKEEISVSPKSVDLLEDPFDQEEVLTYESTEENNVDLQTELQNVVGNNFGVKCEQNVLPISEELKTVIGFEQDVHLDEEEISRLLSELEEDDELNSDKNESQMLFSFDNGGCEIEKGEHDEQLICKGRYKFFKIFFLFFIRFICRVRK